MSAREVVTIQCGHYSNFIGTHWWNLQESGFCYDAPSKEPREILHDCLFREGLTLTGQQTYTPRLVAIDLPGSLKTLKEDGELYDTQQDNTDTSRTWQGEVGVYKTEAALKNEFLEDLDRPTEKAVLTSSSSQDTAGASQGESYHLDNSVEVWSDFLRLHLHSKSLLMVPGGHFHNDANDSFSPFPSGVDVWKDKKFQTQFEDKLHFFVEECDQLQGFHLLSDWTNGFGGLAGCIAQDLHDEFTSKGIFTILSSPLDTPLNKLPNFFPSVLNHVLALYNLCEPSSLIIPLSPLSHPWQTPVSPRRLDSLSLDPSLPYHSSAVFAAGLETGTLFYRTHHNIASLPGLCDTLTDMGRKVCSLGVSLPFSLPPSSNLATQLTLSPLPTSLSPLSPFAHSDDTLWSLATSLRGIPADYSLYSPEDLPYSGCSHPSHVLAVHLAENIPSVNSRLCCIQKPLPLATPFPHILSRDYMKSGHVPICSALQTQSGTGQLLSSLLSLLNSTRHKLRQFPAYSDGCLDTDNCAELTQHISTLADCYTVGGPLSDYSSD